MNRQHLLVGMAAALFALGGLASSAHAQACYPYGFVGYPPYGVSYSNPIYPYGNYPGYSSFKGDAEPGSSGPPPKSRPNAYSPEQLQQYGLPPHPSQFNPKSSQGIPPGPGGFYYVPPGYGPPGFYYNK
jgi:hypothetical protein